MTVSRFAVVFCGLLFSFNSFASDAESQAIDKDVWHGFMHAFNTNDPKLMNSVHTNDVIRVAIDANKIMLGKEYKDKTNEVFQKWNEGGFKQTMEISIHSRAISGDVAFDTGIYKQTRVKDGENNSAYGTFFVILKKTEGKWRIFSDADTGRYEANEAAFKQGRMLSAHKKV